MSLFQFGFQSSRRNTQEQIASASFVPTRDESGLGAEEYCAILASDVAEFADPTPGSKKRKTRGKYERYTPEQRAGIGKYALENGNESARRHFLSTFPCLSESTIRNFKKAYIESMKYQQKKIHPQPVTAIPAKPRGRPPILLDLDGKLIDFLKAIRLKGGVINIHVVRAAAKALIESNPTSSQQLLRFDMPRSWVHSLYKRIGYTIRRGTTSRPPVPRGLYNECRREYLHSINEMIEEHAIPPELVLNCDQTPSSYVSVGNTTMARKGSKTIPVTGMTDKRNITLTFSISLSGEFLPMQIIYSGKTKASLPRGFNFPQGFCLTQNPSHWSNEEETLKLINDVILPYFVKTRKQLKLPETQPALIIWDVFKGQTTEKVKQKLTSLQIQLVTIPPNMTNFFQPLDITVNGVAKKFMRKKFTTYYASVVKQQLDSGRKIDEVDIDLRLTVIKPLHAQWLVDLFNFLTSTKGTEVILKGWKKAGVTGLLDGSTIVPAVDPF